jgi:hypothetical protein
MISLEHHLATSNLCQPNILDNSQEFSALHIIGQAFYFAALMYIYYALREQPVNHHVFAVILRRLRDTLSRLRTIPDYSDFETSTIPHPTVILFWTAFAGGVCGEGGPDEEYFRSLLHEVSKHLNVSTWEEAREILMELAWVPRFCEAPWKNMWDKTVSGQNGKQRYVKELQWFQSRWTKWEHNPEGDVFS